MGPILEVIRRPIMKGKAFTEEQMAFALQQAESGVAVVDNLPKNGHQRSDVLPMEKEI